MATTTATNLKYYVNALDEVQMIRSRVLDGLLHTNGTETITGRGVAAKGLGRMRRAES